MWYTQGMFSRSRHAVVAALLVCVSAIACSSSNSSTPPPAAQPPAPAAPAMKPVVSVKEFMRFTIDPLADNIFDAVTWDISKKGIIATQPRNDEDWEKVKIGAVTLAEAIYLLKVPRPFAPSGDVNNSTGPNPPELSPTQIQAKLDKDPVLWDAKIEALRNAAKEVMDIADRKDVNALFEASADLDNACEACHLEYWYPGDRAAVDEDARQRARFDPSAKRKK
jgi:cytochrome c556